MALTKITSRILDSSGVTILGTIATGVWQGSVIAEAYLQNQSGTNTGDQTTISGNAGTATLADEATILANTRNINGVAFNGSTNITIADATKLPLAGGTLTGALVGTSASFTRLDINSTSVKLKGDLLGNADAAYDIGASGANRPRNLYLSNSIQAADITTTGAGNFSGSVTADDLILTAGTLFGAGNTGFSNRSSDTTLYLQMPATGFNITDNALNTKFILSSGGGATFNTTNTFPITIQTTAGNNGIKILTSATTTSWLLGAQYNVNNAFEITPSTVVGGSTFSTPALTISSGGAATFSGNVIAPKIGVGALNTTFDFYNNGTSYLNSTTTVDAAFNQTGGAASTFSGNVGIGGSPSVNLEIAKSGARIKLIDGTNQLNMGLWDGSNYRIEGDANRKILITSYHSDGIHIGGSGSSHLVIKNGRVGVGTTDPKTTFDVQGPMLSTSFLMPATSSFAWAKVGSLSGFTQGGLVVSIEIEGHSGYNASDDQDYCIKIFMKTSNGSSTNTNGQKFNSWYERSGPYTGSILIKWVNSATDVYDLYVKSQQYNHNSFYNVKRSAGVWTPINSVQSDPGVNSATVLEVLPKNKIPFGLLHLSQGIVFNHNSVTGNKTSVTLNDYEEGSWTPTIAHNDGSGAISLTIVANSAKYVRVGKIVHIKAYLTGVNPNGNQGGNGAYYAIRSLPFESVVYQSWEIIYATASIGSYGGYAQGNNLYFMQNGTNGQNTNSHVNGSQFNAWSNSIGFMFSCTYTMI